MGELATSEATSGALRWEHPIHLLTNPFVLGDVLVVGGASLVGMQGLLLLIGWLVDGELVFIPPLFWALVLGVFLALYVLAAVLVFQNHIPACYSLDERGATMETGGGKRRFNPVLFVLSIVAVSPGGMRMAFGERPREAASIRWREVRRVRVCRRWRVISLWDGWHPVVRLYCPPRMWEKVLARVEEAERARDYRRNGRGTAATGRRWREMLAWAALSVAATLVIPAWGWADDGGYRLAMVAGALVLGAGVLGSVGGWLSALGGAVAALAVTVQFALAALETHRSILEERMMHAYELDTPQLALSLAGCLVLLGMCVWRMGHHQHRRQR